MDKLGQDPLGILLSLFFVVAGLLYLFPRRTSEARMREAMEIRDSEGYRLNFFRLLSSPSGSTPRRVVMGLLTSGVGLLVLWLALGTPPSWVQKAAMALFSLLGAIWLVVIVVWVRSELRRSRRPTP